MAAAAVSQSTFSLNGQTTFPLRLGTSISKPAESKRFASVRYNHKPALRNDGDPQCTIQPQESEEEYELRIKQGDEEYTYAARNTSGDDRYVLLPRGTGKDMEIVLEKLQSFYDFNLTKTPDEKSAGKLARRYPHLPEDEDDEQDIFGDDDATAEEPRDRNNPFDYRNYLKAGSSTTKVKTTQPPQSGANTPLSQPRPASTTPHSRPSKRSEGPFLAQKKRRAQDTAKSNPKRVKAGTEPPASEKEKPPALHRNNIPRLRMDRKASLNPGELVLENATPVQEKPRSAMSLALTGQLDSGRPISLHSAASSPASRAVSPNLRGPVDDGEEFEIGGGDVDQDDADADADVEDLALPSPAQTRQQPNLAADEVTSEKAAGDDEDDLDAQLALAMAEEDDGGGDAVPTAKATESDEESEEE